MKYRRKPAPQTEEVVEAVRLRHPVFEAKNGIHHQVQLIAHNGDWLVVSNTDQRFLSDEAFRREYEVVGIDPPEVDVVPLCFCCLVRQWGINAPSMSRSDCTCGYVVRNRCTAPNTGGEHAWTIVSVTGGKKCIHCGQARGH
jgi:hypothetical protein